MDSPGTDGIASCGLPDGVAPLGPDERVLLDVGMQYDALSFHAWSWAVPGGMAFALVCMIPVALLSGAPPTLAHGALYLVLTCIGVVPILRMWRGYCSRRRLVVTSHRTIGVKFGDPVRVVEIPHGPDVSVSAKEFWLKVKGDRRRIWMWGVPDVFRVSRLVEGLLANATRREQPVPRQAREARILPMDDAPKEEALDIIRSSGLSELAYLLTSLLQHSIRLKTARTDMTHVPLGVSRMGGVPDLPGSVAWPQVEGQYLTFLAQLRMADVASLDVEGLLPRSGWLYFFADASGEIPGYGRDGRVVYFDGREDDLTRAEEPALPAFAHGYKACLLELRGEWTLPDFAVALPAEYCREVKIGGGDTVNHASTTVSSADGVRAGAGARVQPRGGG